MKKMKMNCFVLNAKLKYLITELLDLGLNFLFLFILLVLAGFLIFLIENSAFAAESSSFSAQKPLSLTQTQARQNSGRLSRKFSEFTEFSEHSNFSNFSSFSDISIFGREYEFILFYSTTCPHCTKFEPVLKQYADRIKISVTAFVVDGGKSGTSSKLGKSNKLRYFPETNKNNGHASSNEASQDVIDKFFGDGMDFAVPALFIMNKKNLHAYPVSQGALTYSELVNRMDKLIPQILNNENKEIKK